MAGITKCDATPKIRWSPLTNGTYAFIMNKSLIPVERIGQLILLIRGERVILDSDLAKLYGVTTKRLNEQVKRNKARFPEDFMFQLTAQEKDEVVANCDHLKNLKFSPSLPYVFTEHGAVMAASVLNSPKAVETSIFVVLAFVGLRRFLATHKEIAQKLTELEQRIAGHDADIQAIIKALRNLMQPPDKPSREIGFRVGERKVAYKAKRR